MKLKPADLVKVWDAPDNTRLTPKQVSIRLPIMVAAKISALGEMYPRKTKTELIGDLLATALDQLEDGLPSVDGKLLGVHPDGDVPIYEESWMQARFRELTQKYLGKLEAETGITEASQVPAPSVPKKIMPKK
jgi:hypothetical protein